MPLVYKWQYIKECEYTLTTGIFLDIVIEFFVLYSAWID